MILDHKAVGQSNHGFIANNYDSAELPVVYKSEIEHIANELYKEYNLGQRANLRRGQRIGQCVIGVREFLGIGRDQVSGMAKTTKTNSATPELGAIVKTNESWAGHLGAVIKIRDRQIEIYETNYDGRGTAQTRWLDVDDPRILGYLILDN